MTNHSKPFDAMARIHASTGLDHARVAVNPLAGQMRKEAEVARCDAMLARATPPEAMRAASVAPARGPQVLLPDWKVAPGGTRVRDGGGHWVAASPLARMVINARLRHQKRTPDAPFVPPFTPGQVTVAEDYAAMVERRDAGGIRCASLEAGRAAGGGSGLFIDSFIQDGLWLAELHRRIGAGVALDIRRNMDRGNARRTITTRAALDMLVIAGNDLSMILTRFGWQANGANRKALRLAICGALDRMQGYKDDPTTK